MKLKIKESSYNHRKYNLISEDEYYYWFNIGVESFKRGDKCVPAWNKELNDWDRKHNVKIGTEQNKKSMQITKAWTDGWHYGNTHQSFEW